MDKTGQLLKHRLFLIETLPAPLTPASRHLQIIDRYIIETKLRLRQVRDPYSGERTRLLQKLIAGPGPGENKMAEIHLDEQEFALFDRFAGREVRKNRYFHEYDQRPFGFDIYLGRLEGLKLARAELAQNEEMEKFQPPAFAVHEVTGDSLFSGENLSDSDFGDVAKAIERLSKTMR